MRSSTFTCSEIVTKTAFATVTTGLGAAVSAAIRGGSITESTSVVGLGSGLCIASIGVAGRLGFFAKVPPTPLKPSDYFAYPALLQLMGTTAGYVGTKIFINAAASTEPFVNAVYGLSITIGTFYCCILLIDSYNQNQNKHSVSRRL